MPLTCSFAAIFRARFAKREHQVTLAWDSAAGTAKTVTVKAS